MRRFAIALGLLLVAAGVSAAWGAERETLCIKSARANLRSGPGKNFRITWEVNQFMPLIQIDKKGKWVKVKDVDGDTHWVFGALVDKKLSCLTIKTFKANIRRRPSVRSGKWFTVRKYTSFKRVGKKGKWIKIEYEGETMWVFHTLVWPSSS